MSDLTLYWLSYYKGIYEQPTMQGRDSDGMRAAVNDLLVVVRINGENKKFTIPATYRHDGNSIPRVAHWIAGPWDGKPFPSRLHDYLYEHGLCPRKESDQLFYLAMKLSNSGWWRRYIYYTAVRLFGWVAWKKHRRSKK